MGGGNQEKTKLEDAKPNLKPPCLFQSSQVGITKLQCFNCNSLRSIRRRDDRPVEESWASHAKKVWEKASVIIAPFVEKEK